jgi:hypothetical protein
MQARRQGGLGRLGVNPQKGELRFFGAVRTYLCSIVNALITYDSFDNNPYIHIRLETPKSKSWLRAC